MTLEHVLQVVQKYEELLSDEGYEPGRWEERAVPSSSEALSHVLWMLGEMRKHIEAQETEKVMRWLGFVQGVLWTTDVYSIDEMRDDNR